MAYVSTEEQPLGAVKTHYAIEYREPSGRRRRKRCGSLGQAFSFVRRLPLGSGPEIKLVVRQKKSA